MGQRPKLNNEQELRIAKLRARRVPIEDIAKEFQVHENTIYNIIHKPEIVRVIESLTLEMIADVLTDKFKSGVPADRELYLKFLRQWNPAQKIDANVSIIPSLTALIEADKNASKPK
jgi:hypothetical protein